MSLTFQVEPLTDAWPELVEMHQQHWRESEAHRGPFAPELERYLVHERLGGFVLFTARDEGRMVGSLGVFLIPSRHTQRLIASDDYLYLRPAYRRGWNAAKLIATAEQYCWNRGAEEIEVMAVGDRVGALLRALDYQPMAVQYSKQRVPTAPTVERGPVGETTHDATARFSIVS